MTGGLFHQEPIKEAGILEGRNGIKETCLQVIWQFISTLCLGILVVQSAKDFGIPIIKRLEWS